MLMRLNELLSCYAVGDWFESNEAPNQSVR